MIHNGTIVNTNCPVIGLDYYQDRKEVITIEMTSNKVTFTVISNLRGVRFLEHPLKCLVKMVNRRLPELLPELVDFDVQVPLQFHSQALYPLFHLVYPAIQH